MAAPLLPEGLKISVTDNLVSAGYVELTRDLMIKFGVHAQKKSLQFLINPSRLVPTNLLIEGDASAATYLWGLGALSRGMITVENLSPESKQPDLKFLDLLKAMGADVQTETGKISVTAGSVLSALDADLELMPDAV